jgi:hypothetical protein
MPLKQTFERKDVETARATGFMEGAKLLFEAVTGKTAPILPLVQPSGNKRPRVNGRKPPQAVASVPKKAAKTA